MSESIEELIERAAQDILRAEYTIALTGAGVSTESGIPDFRGPDGVWTKDPEAEKRAYEAYEKFMEDPKLFWEDYLSAPPAKVEMWRAAEPNPSHYAIAELEHLGLLKRVITQNIDGLHERAGNSNLLEYHGGIYKLRCPSCGWRDRLENYDLPQMRENNQLPPRCKSCGNAIKLDVVYFGEPIPSDVAIASEQEARKCDLMMVCGTSAVVYPFASLPMVAGRQPRSRLEEYFDRGTSSPNAIIFEVNAEPTPLTQAGISQYLIQGKTGEILPRIVDRVKQLRD